jgi:hypothetical protein
MRWEMGTGVDRLFPAGEGVTGTSEKSTAKELGRGPAGGTSSTVRELLAGLGGDNRRLTQESLAERSANQRRPALESEFPHSSRYRRSKYGWPVKRHSY